MNPKERLIEFVKFVQKEENPNISFFEKECGLSNGYVNGIRKSVGPTSLDKILRKYPNLNKIWLLHGEGEMTLTPVEKNPKKETSDIIELNALTTVMARNIAKMEAKVFGRDIDEVFDEFEKDVRSEMRKLINGK